MTDDRSGGTAGDLPTWSDPGAFVSRVTASLPFNRPVGLRCHTAVADSAAGARAAVSDGDRVELTLPVTVSSADGVVAEVEIDYVFKRFDDASGS